jgi:hypothetical protein
LPPRLENKRKLKLAAAPRHSGAAGFELSGMLGIREKVKAITAYCRIGFQPVFLVHVSECVYRLRG